LLDQFLSALTFGVDHIGRLVGPWNMENISNNPDEKLREHLKALYPHLGEEELEEALRNLKQYLILAGEIAKENLRKEKGDRSE